jgi:hypothetical protein
MQTFLEEIGINLVQSVAGLFGALLMVGKKSALNVKETLFAIVTGVASANYLTPVVVDFLKISGTQYENGIAFVLGFVGLKGVETISTKVFKNIKNDSSKPN